VCEEPICELILIEGKAGELYVPLVRRTCWESAVGIYEFCEDITKLKITHEKMGKMGTEKREIPPLGHLTTNLLICV